MTISKKRSIISTDFSGTFDADLLQKIAENKINEAMQSGEFENLMYKGQRMDLEEYFSMPPERRAAFQLLKNAHIVPTEVELMKETGRLKER
jgi:hypothetical protein